MPVALGQTLCCRNSKCGTEFVCTHPRQRYCSRRCAIADKESRAGRRLKRKAQHQRWVDKNYLVLREKRRAWYQANKEKILTQNKAYRASLPREVVLARRARSQEQHREHEKQRYHQTRAWLPWLNAFRGSKARANKHKIPFTLTKEWAEQNWTGRCAVTNIKFVLSTKRNPYLLSPSLDRIIPSAGYTADNSRFVLHAVNALKGAGTDNQMLEIAIAIVASKTLILVPE